MGDMEPILVALSGGIDSAATVLLLKERGYRVTGVYIDMLGDETARNKAIDVARRLGIELHVENIVEEFHQKIISHTLSEHMAGRTPSPCARCNSLIKWDVALRVADRIGINRIATGHYVRVIDGSIHKGIDPAKDQSYYLWGLKSTTLARAVTPLGEFTKQQVREYLGRHAGFEDLATSGESMGICFVGRMPYGEFLRRNMNVTSGDVVDSSGDVIGCHDGYQLYTIGQKRSFTGGGAVSGIDPVNNRITTVAQQQSIALYSKRITIKNYILHRMVAPVGCRIKIRGIGRNPQSVVTNVEILTEGRLLVELGEADAWAVASGQPLVFYDGDCVVGGGIIT